MPSEATNKATRREWRQLGFYYDRDDETKTWRVIGSKTGLALFADAISRFASNPKNSGVSEHDHLGPYMYLEIGSWPHPEITDHWIAGPLDRLYELSIRIRERLVQAVPYQIIALRSGYSPGSPYELLLEVREEEFDPATEDSGCW